MSICHLPGLKDEENRHSKVIFTGLSAGFDPFQLFQCNLNQDAFIDMDIIKLGILIKLIMMK